MAPRAVNSIRVPFDDPRLRLHFSQHGHVIDAELYGKLLERKCRHLSNYLRGKFKLELFNSSSRGDILLLEICRFLPLETNLSY